MSISPVESQGRAPVVNHEGDVAGYPDFLQQGIQKPAVFLKGIGLRSTLFKFVRVSHPDQVRRDTSAQPADMGYDIAPQIG